MSTDNTPTGQMTGQEKRLHPGDNQTDRHPWTTNDPGNPSHLTGLDRALQEARRFLAQGLIPQAQVALAGLPPKHVAVALVRARILARQERLTEATEMLQHLAEEYPHDVEPIMVLLDVLLEAGKTEIAISIAEVARGQFPDTLRLHLALLDARELAGQEGVALQEAKDLILRFPAEPALLERHERLKSLAHAEALEQATLQDIREEVIEPRTVAVRHDIEMLELFLSRFSGRTGMYAEAFLGRCGKGSRAGTRGGYRPVHEPMTASVVRSHLAGDRVIGCYPVMIDNTSRFLAFDLDIRKGLLPRFDADPLEHRRLKKCLMASGRQLLDVATSVGLPLLPEFSGHKGLHFWAFSATPFPARHFRALGNWILNHLPTTPVDLQWELFPKQDTVELGGCGNLIKLPLGVHPKTRYRSLFLSPKTFQPESDQCAALRDHPMLTIDRFGEILGRLIIDETRVDLASDTTRSPSAGESRVEVPPTPATVGYHDEAGFRETDPTQAGSLSIAIRIPWPQRFPDAIEHLLAGCAMVWHLVDAVRAGNTPDASHRHVLTYVFSALGEDGRVFLHQLLSRTTGYGPDTVNRAIRAVPPHPMSCAKVRKNLPDLLSHVPCECQFRLPVGIYASPVVHAGMLPASDIHVGSGGKLQPVLLSPRESYAGASGGIDRLIAEYHEIRARLATLLRREELVRCRLQNLFAETGTECIQTALGTYSKLPASMRAMMNEDGCSGHEALAGTTTGTGSEKQVPSATLPESD